VSPIYEAPLKKRLEDLARAVQSALLLGDGDMHPMSDREIVEARREGLMSDELAIGNWIVRPRFKASESKDDPSGSGAHLSGTGQQSG
jgi:hypothetical protein